MDSRYNAEIVAGTLLPNESKAIARLILENTPKEEFTRLLTIENILQKRSPGTALRKAKLIQNRFSLVDEELLKIIVEENRQTMMQALLVVAIKHNKLIGDFLLRVVREKWQLFETDLKPDDWNLFLAECEQIDETVKKWKTSTRDKLGQVVKRCLVEANYLEVSSKHIITPVLLFPKIKQYLIANNEQYVLDCMDIFS